MNNDVGYSNGQAAIVSGFTILVAMAFGWHAGEILGAYVAASIGLFIFFALGHMPWSKEDENVRFWPYTELARWGMVAWLMFLNWKK